MALEPEFLAPMYHTTSPETSVRDALVTELLAENAKARRMLRKDHLGDENDEWRDQHAHLNFLIDLLEED